MRKVYLTKYFILILTICWNNTLFSQFSTMELSPIPEAVSNNAVCGGVINQQMFVYSFGGIDTSKVYSGIHNRCYKYDVQNDHWIQLPNLPNSPTRIATGASIINNVAYIIGGYHVFSNGNEQSSALVHRFDIQSDSFLSDAKPLPKSTDDHVQAVYNDSLIFVISGWSNTGNIADVQIYNPQLDTWLIGTSVPNNHLYKSFGASGTIIGDTIYYFGGAQMGNNFPIQNQIRKGYINPNNVTQISWSIDTINPNIVGYRMAATHYGNTIRWIGGSNATYNYNGIGYAGNIPIKPNRRILEFTPSTNSWDTTSSPYINMDFRGIASFDCDMILVGGMDSNQQVSSRVLHLQCLSNNTSYIQRKHHKVSIYPNPTSTGFSISNHSKPSVVSIYNSNGQLCGTQMASQNKLIPTAHLPSGIYFVRIEYQDHTLVKKLIINHKKSD